MRVMENLEIYFCHEMSWNLGSLESHGNVMEFDFGKIV